MIDNSVEPKATTTTEGTSSSTDLSQLLAIVLSTISVLLLSILAVTVIFVNIWKANRKTVNPFESQTLVV